MKLPCEGDAHTLKSRTFLSVTECFSGQSDFYLGSVVRHDIGAAHSFRAFAWWDAQMVTAAVAHGHKTAGVPPLVCEDVERTS